MPPLEFDLPPGGIHGRRLAAELVAAGVPVPYSEDEEEDRRNVNVYIRGVENRQVVCINAPAEHAATCRAVLAAHRRPADVRPRAEKDVAAEVEAELIGAGWGKPQAKMMAKLLARQERGQPGTIAAMGLTTATTEAIS